MSVDLLLLLAGHLGHPSGRSHPHTKSCVFGEQTSSGEVPTPNTSCPHTFDVSAPDSPRISRNSWTRLLNAVNHSIKCWKKLGVCRKTSLRYKRWVVVVCSSKQNAFLNLMPLCSISCPRTSLSHLRRERSAGRKSQTTLLTMQMNSIMQPNQPPPWSARTWPRSCLRLFNLI